MSLVSASTVENATTALGTLAPAVPVRARDEFSVASDFIRQVIRSPAALALAGDTEAMPCETVAELDAQYRDRLQQCMSDFLLAVNADAAFAERVRDAEITRRMIRHVERNWGGNRLISFSLFLPLKIYDLIKSLGRDKREAIEERYKWLISTHALEKVRRNDVFNKIQARLAIILCHENIREIVRAGYISQDQINEFKQLQALHDAMFPRQPPVLARYRLELVQAREQMRAGGLEHEISIIQNLIQNLGISEVP